MAPSIVSQIDTYLASVNNVADPNALYLLSGGGNDVKEAQALYPATDTQDQINYMISEANSFAAAIEQLHADGAQYILIRDLNGTGVLFTTFENTLWADLESTGTPFLVADDLSVVAGISNQHDSIRHGYGCPHR